MRINIFYLILAIQLSLFYQFSLAVENTNNTVVKSDAEAIRVIINNFTNNYSLGNSDGVMHELSLNSNDLEGKDYNKFKEKWAKGFAENLANKVKCSSKVDNLVVHGGQANVNVTFTCEGYDSKEGKEKKTTFTKDIRLIKEEGGWKIIAINFDVSGTLAHFKDIIQGFVNALALNKVDEASMYISFDYNDNIGGDKIDYYNFKEKIGKDNKEYSEIINSTSCVDFNITNMNLADTSAVFDISFKCLGNSTEILPWQVCLSKDYNYWKIKQFHKRPDGLK